MSNQELHGELEQPILATGTDEAEQAEEQGHSEERRRIFDAETDGGAQITGPDRELQDRNFQGVIRALTTDFDDVLDEQAVEEAVNFTRERYEHTTRIQNMLPILVKRMVGEHLSADARLEGERATKRHLVLFLDGEDGVLGQMAAAIGHDYGNGRLIFAARSIHEDPVPVDGDPAQVMRENMVWRKAARPDAVDDSDLDHADLVVTFSSDVHLPEGAADPEIWEIEDPQGKAMEQVREIFDALEERVLELVERF